MLINFVSRNVAERMKPHKNMALISIIEPTAQTMKTFDQWEHKIELKFHDADPVKFRNSSFKGYTLFSREQAKKIIEFVLGLPENVTNILVHCAAGISRSAGVALFLSEHVYKLGGLSNVALYNRYVYSELLKTWINEYNNGEDLPRLTEG